LRQRPGKGQESDQFYAGGLGHRLGWSGYPQVNGVGQLVSPDLSRKGHNGKDLVPLPHTLLRKPVSYFIPFAINQLYSAENGNWARKYGQTAAEMNPSLKNRIQLTMTDMNRTIRSAGQNGSRLCGDATCQG
jgi:hypothetical protein